MNAKGALRAAIKIFFTVAIFVAIFAEWGGGPVPVDRVALTSDQATFRANPEMPGIVGKLKAKLSGATLPAPTVPLPLADVCKAAAEGTVYAETVDGRVVPFKALRHCENDVFTLVLASANGPEQRIGDVVANEVWIQEKGFQLVPMDMKDLWREITSVDMAVFLPWFAFAMLIKLVGIFANIYRWQILLRGQGLEFGFGWLSASYFVGRYFGIVTPSTMGLDGWRLYDTIRLSRKPVECTTALAVERVIGLVGLLAVILMFMPFADLGNKGLGELVSALKLPIAAGVFFGLLLLLQPNWFQPLVRLVPTAKLRNFVTSAITSATAYSSNRMPLLVALGCAVFGQVTTMFMYFGNAMALQVEGVTTAQVLYASAVMTLGTFLAPSASGEGVRELVFVALLQGHTTAAKAFLIGHLGFWIEKLPLSIPGGWFLLRAPDAYKRVTQDDLARLKQETAQEQAAGAS